MNVLLLGAGGREHALALALSKSPDLTRLIVVPGNPGTAAIAENVSLSLDDHAGLLALARQRAVELVVVGPEAPLVAGIADLFRDAGIPVFGPSAAAAQLEGSKSFTKDLCRAFAIPTAAYETFTDAEAAKTYVRQGAFPVVIKADGLAAGKGVIIAADVTEAESALDDIFGGLFGGAGARVVIEDFLEGEELSFFALCDGTRALPFASAQDHKRVGEGDIGPNTGGMGAVSPAPSMTPTLEGAILERIIRPTLAGMAARGMPFQGVLFAGLMVDPNGDPQLIEYNVRFGDPEAEVMLPRLDQDLLALLQSCAEGALPEWPLRFQDDVALGVVMAARGYPEAPETGTPIVSLPADNDTVTVFHAGTREADQGLVAAGGRVLVVTARGATAEQAQARAYAAVDAVDWPGGFCRRDIGWRAIARERAKAAQAEQ
ncbi:phosphoribosylamine--glycine ligase [Lichenihabitans sp. Uapishka_5]|uniref:phosphoribosylamine--glycine ligase n=1 Tax=Lichenihabitans sp. Uapishka_5 TaxID=3037302 RepID=UPI0029E81E6C|nr:phosphoribosylamine--glycine ligase [Lichenihabitans sp. Uapishka_5]MDX7949814.1 phosphoribosylamine--glycine ligase [Lichenihabitans sp. Uapishka_5]